MADKPQKSPQQMSKEIAATCLWISCVNNLWLATGLLCLPILFPTTAMEKGTTGFGTGMLLIVPAVSAAIATPLISSHVEKWGMELVMLIAGCAFGFGIFLLGIVSGSFSGLVAFDIICAFVMFFVGFGISANQIAENLLMIKYSQNKDDREKNLAAIRKAAIYSIMVAAFVISVMYTLGSFLAAFMFIGGAQFVLSPLLYWRLSVCKTKYDALNPPAEVPAVAADPANADKAGTTTAALNTVVVEKTEEEKKKEAEKTMDIMEMMGDKFFAITVVSLWRYWVVYFYYLVLLSPMLVTYQALNPSVSVLAYFVAPIIYLLCYPIVQWFMEEFGMTQRTMILIGQSIEAFGCIIICGDVSALGKGYMIALTGVGCACFGLSQCVVSISLMKELQEMTEKTEEGQKAEKADVIAFVNNLNIFVSAVGQGVGFFFGCWIGIGSSYETAFELAAVVTIMVMVVQLCIYNLDCDRKKDMIEKDEEQQNLVNKDSDPTSTPGKKAN